MNKKNLGTILLCFQQNLIILIFFKDKIDFYGLASEIPTENQYLRVRCTNKLIGSVREENVFSLSAALTNYICRVDREERVSI